MARPCPPTPSPIFGGSEGTRGHAAPSPVPRGSLSRWDLATRRSIPRAERGGTRCSHPPASTCPPPPGVLSEFVILGWPRAPSGCPKAVGSPRPALSQHRAPRSSGHRRWPQGQRAAEVRERQKEVLRGGPQTLPGGPGHIRSILKPSPRSALGAHRAQNCALGWQLPGGGGGKYLGRQRLSWGGVWLAEGGLGQLLGLGFLCPLPVLLQERSSSTRRC